MILLLFIGLVWSQDPFKTVVYNTPSSFDPAQFSGTESVYIFHNLFRGLYGFDDEKVVPEGAKNCIWKSKLHLQCELNPDFKWSDGSPVVAADYERAFKYLIAPETKSREISSLLLLKNATEILKSQKKPEDLGVKSEGKGTLHFYFIKEDSEFIEKLTSPILVPWKQRPDITKASTMITNGPYSVEKFLPDQKMILKPNPHYPYGNPKRPTVEVIFINEDSTAQNLYDSKQINLLPRIDVSLIALYNKRPDFYQKVFTRFDYIGFGPELMKNKNLRKAIALALDYEELAQLLHAAGRPGCAGLTDYYLNLRPCYNFNLKEAKKAFNKVPKELKEKRYVFKYSRAGGDNIQKTAEWYQNQLKKHLGLNIDLESIEQGMYLQTLRTAPSDIFRKGINLDRPTCTSALENFKSQSNDNYIKYTSKKFDKNLERLEKIADPELKKKLCSEMVQDLLNEYVLIPQGVIHYSMLSDEKFVGWKFNEMNKLDLSDLAHAPAP